MSCQLQATVEQVVFYFQRVSLWRVLVCKVRSVWAQQWMGEVPVDIGPYLCRIVQFCAFSSVILFSEQCACFTVWPHSPLCVRVRFKHYMFCLAQPLLLLGAVIFKTVLKVTAKRSSADTLSFSLVSCFTIWSLNTTKCSSNFDILK